MSTPVQITDALAIAVSARELFPKAGVESLEPNEAQVVLALRVKADQGPADVAAALRLPLATVSNTLSRLHRAGLVAEKGDPDDRRRRYYRLTKKGTTRAETLTARLADRLAWMSDPQANPLSLLPPTAG